MITSINEYQIRVTFFIVGELGMTAYYHDFFTPNGNRKGHYHRDPTPS